jgi:hypothetical protein
MTIEFVLTDRAVLRDLEHLVTKYEGVLEEAEQALKKAEESRDICKDRLAKARSLLEYERERVGKQIPLDDKSPYAGLALREAAVRVISSHSERPITSKEITETLQSHGYPLETKYPGRALHAALIGVDEVEKVGPGTYRLRGSTNNSREAADLEPSVN